MDTLTLTILRDRGAAAVLALGLVSLLPACGDQPKTADVDILPRPADAGVVERDARPPQPSEQPCDTTQCMDLGGGPGLPPTTFRRLISDQARPPASP
jgi:hypothetical protein